MANANIITINGVDYDLEDTTARTTANAAVKDVKVNGTSILDSGKVASITINNTLTSDATAEALSAAQGKELANRITQAAQVGRYLSTWNGETGKPTTDPVLPSGETSYSFKSGDYYILLKVLPTMTSNLIPSGDSYTPGTASTTHFSPTTDLPTIKIGDRYVYSAPSSGSTGGTWQLVPNVQPEDKVRDIKYNGASIVDSETGIAAIPTATASQDGFMTSGQVQQLNGKQEFINCEEAGKILITTGNHRPGEENLAFRTLSDTAPSATVSNPDVASVNCVYNAVNAAIPAGTAGEVVTYSGTAGTVSALGFDAAPTASSTKLVNSGAVQTAIAATKATYSSGKIILWS